MRRTPGLIFLPLLLLTGCPTKLKFVADGGSPSDGGSQADGNSRQDGSTDMTATIPSLQITSPPNGSYTNSTVAITAMAAGGPAPASVSLLADGDTTPIATTTSPSPYIFSWDTTGVIEGAHTIVAK